VYLRDQASKHHGLGILFIFPVATVVLLTLVSRYDERLTGFGWNKVMHMEHLHELGYAFAVVPTVYLVHQPHAPSPDLTTFRRSVLYKICMGRIKDEIRSSQLKKIP